MYRITNKVENQTRDYPSKDAMLIDLEGVNDKFLELNLTGMFEVTVLDKKGKVLGEGTFELPVLTKQILHDTVEKVLSTFTTQSKEEPKAEVPPAPVNSSTQQAILPTPPTPTVSPTPPKTNRKQASQSWKSWLSLALALVALALSCYSLTASLTKAPEAVKTRTVVQTKENQGEEHSVDVFSRYFLGAYYGQSKNLSDYLSDNLSDTDMKPSDKGQPVSVLLEKTEKKDKTTTVTYVIALKDGDETTTKRVAFSVQKDTDSTYGFSVTSDLEVSNYPK